MTYQPNLFIRNVGKASVVKVYDQLKELGFGKIDYLQVDTIKDETCIFVKMRYWNLGMTEATRIKLQEGNPLTIYHTENSYWKMFSYENRFSEEIRAEEQKKKEIARKRYEEEKKQKEIARKRYEEEKKQKEIARKHYDEEQQEETDSNSDSGSDNSQNNISRPDYDTPPHIILDYTYAKEIYPKLISKYVSLLNPYKKSIKFHALSVQ